VRHLQHSRQSVFFLFSSHKAQIFFEDVPVISSIALFLFPYFSTLDPRPRDSDLNSSEKRPPLSSLRSDRPIRVFAPKTPPVPTVDASSQLNFFSFRQHAERFLSLGTTFDVLDSYLHVGSIPGRSQEFNDRDRGPLLPLSLSPRSIPFCSITCAEDGLHRCTLFPKSATVPPDFFPPRVPGRACSPTH